MLATLKTITLFGLKPHVIDIEVDIHRGLPKFSIVGLGDAAIQESKERIRSALKNSGFTFPRGIVTVNLAPAELRKQGPRFDLPIALGILQASGQLDMPDLSHSLILGELSFSGDLRGISGVLPSVSQAKKMGFKDVFLPAPNQAEAGLIEGIDIYGIKNLEALIESFQGTRELKPFQATENPFAQSQIIDHPWDMKYIKGNEQGKRVLEIAAAGGHNVLMSGPPGSGKTMLAQSLSSILPDLTIDEALEVTNVYSIAGQLPKEQACITQRPFRSVHHTASSVAIIGGGNPPRPGEISLSHRGILFLDEFPEFPSKTLEMLRQPLEDGKVSVSRASGTCEFPAQMMLVAAMNPTPSGYEADDERCTSTPFEIQRYQNKLSGPLLDRIDLHIKVPHVPIEDLQQLDEGEPSHQIQKRVQTSREKQQQRFSGTELKTNSEMGSKQIRQYCALDEPTNQFLQTAVQRMQLSGRSYFRILKVARTIADLENTETITTQHVAEAIKYKGS